MGEPSDMSLADTIRARVAERLQWAELSPIQAATKHGLPRDTLRNLFRRDSALPRADTLADIARALDTSVAFLVGETANPGMEKWADQEQLDEIVRLARPIPVRAELSDGFRKPLDAPIGYIDLNVPGYETADLSAFVVKDRAMDLYYEVDRYVVTAPVGLMGLQIGDHVVAVRMKGEGDEVEVETFIREYADGPIGPQLVGQSSDLTIAPISIKELTHREVLIGGIVVADFKAHGRAPIPMAYEWSENESG